MANNMENLIKELSSSSDFYLEWFDSATETQKNMIWESVWNQAAEKHSENDFIQGLYNFYQIRGYLTYKQWGYLIRTIYPQSFKSQSLKDRLK
jgi:hypothetical protein